MGLPKADTQRTENLLCREEESGSNGTNWEHFSSPYGRYMLRDALSVLKSLADAEDAVQIAYIKLAKQPELLSNPWAVRTVVRRTAIDLLRKRKQIKEVPLEEWAEAMPAPDMEKTLAVKNCIKVLPSKDREIILLRYSHGYTVSEIAEILNITESAVYKRLDRAKERLERLCREEGLL